MSGNARGTFDVKVTPQTTSVDDKFAELGRMSIDKTFHGDLNATGTGAMLAASTSTEGSAGYVAIERVLGNLEGRTGSFVLQHNGTMTRGTPALTVSVIPDSGTGELTGITGTMSIIIEDDGSHRYDFSYTLPADR